jgi:serine/threonine-protein kinase
VIYDVMELLDGIDLDHLVRRFGPLPPARAAHLLAQACESLEEAHCKGLVHRDIKPANLYVCRSGTRFDFVKVLDFGLVAHQRTFDQALTRLTLPQQAAGTPAYMPPEIARGAPLDHRADLYALGCVAFWLLTGRTVFQGESVYDMVSQHLRAEPEPPSGFAPGVPPAFDALVLACLAKLPEERPKDARTVGRMLREMGSGDPWTDEMAEAWWREFLEPQATPQ